MIQATWITFTLPKNHAHINTLHRTKTKYLTKKSKNFFPNANSITPIVKIRAKDYNPWFDGREVERFIKKVENIAEIVGASGREIARKISFWTKDEEISYHIERIPGYETAYWDQFKVDMKRIWGTVSTERRYRLSSITDLFTKTQQEGGIRNMAQYRKFIGEYEAIITYLKRYQYIQGYINHNQEVLESLSTSVRESIYKEIIKDRAMVQTLDGGYIIPTLEILKLYIEEDLDAKVLIQKKEFYKPKPSEKKTIFEDESWDEVLKQVKELTQKLKDPPQPEPQPRNEGKESVKEVLNQLKPLSEAINPPRKNWNNNQEQRFPQNNQPYRSKNPLPPFPSIYKPYIQAQMAPRPQLKCVYWKEEVHSATRCTHLAENLDKRIVRSQGASYLFPNYQRVPMEGNEIFKNIVRAFAKEQAELNKKFMEKPAVKQKQEEEVKPTEKNQKINQPQLLMLKIGQIGSHPPFPQPMIILNPTLD
ncbi:hypothetical protein O181_020066 [Austropuccinia psidii MF-1]|uniref:Uncharacterized protein n=1 Tax=Austropuccinia psidii MF-1 TaxID=1389203 RepID=A0A9Q3CCS7_9BASI|nr:hypothetical protein [Austropuccinia psidii MF-1]